MYTGRAKIADQAYPAHMMQPGFAKQAIPDQPSVLTELVKTLPSGQRTFTIGYDSSSPDNQLVANLLSAELAADGLSVKVQAYPTSQIYGWVARQDRRAPPRLLDPGWPDAAPPYHGAHIASIRTAASTTCTAPPRRSPSCSGRGCRTVRADLIPEAGLGGHRMLA